jgi:hypothetical protein
MLSVAFGTAPKGFASCLRRCTKKKWNLPAVVPFDAAVSEERWKEGLMSRMPRKERRVSRRKGGKE